MEWLSARHLLWLGVTVAFVAACICMRRFELTSRVHTVFRAALFVLVFLNEAAWFSYRHFVVELSLIKNLPLHLCDISVFVLLAALVTANRRLAEISYFPGVAGALLAVIVPAISETGAIRTIAEARYFVTHIALVGGGFYLTFGRRYRPPARAIWRSYLAVHVYALLITPINWLLGTNYFFTISPPKQVAFLQQFPQLVFAAGVSATFLALFSLMYVPFLRKGEGRI